MLWHVLLLYTYLPGLRGLGTKYPLKHQNISILCASSLLQAGILLYLPHILLLTAPLLQNAPSTDVSIILLSSASLSYFFQGLRLSLQNTSLLIKI